ncbi:Two-on-two hemoglobin-3 [Gonapodya sp. JEL0774]|nr:Two-on-two hemoglobin-3 [Gonapodya sp. JEL0774]
MQGLQEWAAKKAGIPLDEAFVIDEKPSVYSIIGHDAFVRLSTEFYNRVYADDEEPWFRDIFSPIAKEDAIHNQYEFFIQRMGGPPLFSRRKGHPALIGRHAPFTVTPRAAERWLFHMSAALDAVEGPVVPARATGETVETRDGSATEQAGSLPCIDRASRERMWKFLQHTAWFITGAQESRRGGLS